MNIILRNSFVLCILTLALSVINKFVINYDLLFYTSLIDKISSNQIEIIVNFQRKWEWVSYLLIPLLLLFKVILVSIVLYIGIYINNRDEFTFKKVYDIVVNAEFLFLGVGILKIIWFYFFQINYTLEDIQYFYPLSALTIIGYKGLEPWLIYPFQTLNVFELVYIIILSYQIGTLTKTNADTGLKIVASSYLPALLLWVTVVMFFTLNFS